MESDSCKRQGNYSSAFLHRVDLDKTAYEEQVDWMGQL